MTFLELVNSNAVHEITPRWTTGKVHRSINVAVMKASEATRAVFSHFVIFTASPATCVCDLLNYPKLKCLEKLLCTFWKIYNIAGIASEPCQLGNGSAVAWSLPGSHKVASRNGHVISDPTLPRTWTMYWRACRGTSYICQRAIRTGV